MKLTNILTIDVEDYFQVANFQRIIKPSEWDNFVPRIVGNAEKIVEILSETDTKATFFILGWIANKFPKLVKKIHQSGHEVASHGFMHQLIHRQSKDKFRKDIRRAKQIIEDIIEEPVTGYRAPSFSITKESLWAIDVLVEEGYKYDSSISPIYHDKGGLPKAKRYPYKISKNGSCMWEIPISTLKIFGHNIPFSGGGYFRLLPYGLIKRGIKNINKENKPVIVYLHPWELDPDQPRINAGVLNNFRHYVNISKTENKLKQLLKDFKFTTINEYINTTAVEADRGRR